MAKQIGGDTKYLLFQRSVLVLAVGLGFLWVVWKSGWAADIIAMDSLYISRVIMALFVVATIDCLWKIVKTSRELNIAQKYVRHMREGNKREQSAIESGNSRVAVYLSDIKGLNPEQRREVGDMFADDVGIGMTGVAYNIGRLSALGFIGTLVGIAVALKVFDIPLTDSSQVLGLFNKVPPGLRIAVYPALLGGIAALWLDFFFQILDEGTQKLISWVKKAGVCHATQQSS